MQSHRRLVGLNFEQLQREADFRFSLIRVCSRLCASCRRRPLCRADHGAFERLTSYGVQMRENAESIAFYGGEQIEMKEIKRRLDKCETPFSSLRFLALCGEQPLLLLSI